MTAPAQQPRKPGRPALQPGAGKLARLELRTQPARVERAKALAAAAGVSLTVWIERLIDNAATTKEAS